MSTGKMCGRAVLALAVTTALVASGCGSGETIKLQEAPPVAIEPPKKEDPGTSRTSLKAGAPPKGSSSGINFNPSETNPR